MTLAKGRIATARFVTSVSELTREDLAKLQAPRATLTTPQKLRESHHQVARLLALGLAHTAIAEATGYSVQRVSQLGAAPAMQELVARLRERADETTVEAMTDYNNQVARRRNAAERHLIDYIDRLDDEGEIMPPKLALALAADGADRTGFGKQSTRVNVNEDFAAKLEAAIGRSGKVIDINRSRPVTINATPSPEPIPQIKRRL